MNSNICQLMHVEFVSGTELDLDLEPGTKH